MTVLVYLGDSEEDASLAQGAPFTESVYLADLGAHRYHIIAVNLIPIPMAQTANAPSAGMSRVRFCRIPRMPLHGREARRLFMFWQREVRLLISGR